MKKILVVDDEIDICDFVKNFFEERNFEVLTAFGGVDAIRVIKKEKPCVVLLDIKMKDMDGIETLGKIRQFDKDVNVIMVTAVEEKDKMDAARKLGARAYITKPLILEELEATVAQYTKEVKK